MVLFLLHASSPFTQFIHGSKPFQISLFSMLSHASSTLVPTLLPLILLRTCFFASMALLMLLPIFHLWTEIQRFFALTVPLKISVGEFGRGDRAIAERGEADETRRWRGRNEKGGHRHSAALLRCASLENPQWPDCRFVETPWPA